MTPEPFVTAEEIAAHLKITRRQTLEMTRKQLIPAHPLGTGKHRRVWRYKISEFDLVIGSSERKPSTSNEEGALAKTLTHSTVPFGSPRNQQRKSNG